MINELKAIVGDNHVLTGADMVPWKQDWIKKYDSEPICVVRPANTQEVSAIVKFANASRIPIVPVSGNTGLSGGTQCNNGIVLSLTRMNAIREIRPESRVAIVESGVILETLHDAVARHDLVFPLTFGAKGAALIGGVLSTNAGGSNVVRYGNTRDLCLGIEVVLPSGEILDLMSELHKNNSGYDLRHLMIGAEGTLGIITAAVLRLSPNPLAYATAMVATPTLTAALELLNRVQIATGGAVEAFEYMPDVYMKAYAARHPENPSPFDQDHPICVMIEVATTVEQDAKPAQDGSIPLTARLENILGDMFEVGLVTDAVIAQSEAQRASMWQRREAVAEIVLSNPPICNNDVAFPLDKVETFLSRADAAVHAIDPKAKPIPVAHLGDGNIHYAIWMDDGSDAAHDQVMEAVEEIVKELGGSFSAEHGIGLSKLPSMRRRKNPIALQTMRSIKAALDPMGIMNPGKLLPD